MKQPILNGILESPFDLNGYGFVNIGGLLGTFQAYSAVLDTLAATSPSYAGIQILQFAAPGSDSLLGIHSNGTPFYTAASGLESTLTFNPPLSRTGNVVSIPAATGSVDGYLSHTDWTTFNGKQNALGFTAVPDTRTVNGHALSGNVTVTPTDLNLVIGTNVEAAFAAGTTGQYFRGDKTFQTLNQAAVAGLTLADGPSFASVYLRTGSGSGGTSLESGAGSSSYVATFIGGGTVAYLASPALTGTPTAPTASPGTNTTQIATTAFVSSAIPDLSGYVPTSRTVNGHALSGNVTVTPTDLGLVIGTDVQAYNVNLAALSGLTGSANQVPYFTGGGAMSMTAFTSVGRAIVGQTTAANARITLGLVIGTDVQAYNANLATWAGIAPGTGVGTALAANVGSAGAFVTFNGALGTPSSGTLTNATGLPIGGIDFLDTDGTLAANSDAKVPSQKAVKTYVYARPTKCILSVACWGFSVDDQSYIPMQFFADSTDYFVSPSNTTFPPSPSEYRTEFVIPYDCTLRNLYVRTADGIDPASPSTVVTVRKNAADTSLALTVPTATHTTVSDTTHSVSFSAGDRLTIKINNSDGDYMAQSLSSLTIECDSP